VGVPSTPSLPISDAPTSGPRPSLTVVIVNYNSWPDVARLVAGLARAPEVAAGICRLVVVDNASDEPPPPDLCAPGVLLVRRRDNGGFAAGVNAAWHASESPWLLLLNPDVVAGPDLLARVLGRLERDRRRPEGAPGVVGFALRNADGTRQPSVGALPSLARSVWEPLIPRSRRKYQAGWRTRAGPVPWVTGACMLVNAVLLGDLGGMDEDFFLYYEEVALCRLAALRGWSVEFDPSVEVVHLHPLQQRRVSSKLRVITRHSKLLYFRKHLPRWQFIGLTWVVAAEAAARGLWAGIRGRAGRRRAWRTIGAMAVAMRHGAVVRGRDALALAEGAGRHSTDPHPGGDGVRESSPLSPRERVRVRASSLAPVDGPSPRPSPGGRGSQIHKD
jgi:N-acetylglucosaminyl-diphospho-decaprenol L-rhamnosyltransferase